MLYCSVLMAVVHRVRRNWKWPLFLWSEGPGRLARIMPSVDATMTPSLWTDRTALVLLLLRSASAELVGRVIRISLARGDRRPGHVIFLLATVDQAEHTHIVGRALAAAAHVHAGFFS